MLIWIGVTILCGWLLVELLLVEFLLPIDPQLAEILALVVASITTLVVVRLLIKLYVLRQIRYEITETAIRSEFDFLYYRKSRELPFDRVRGLEVEQDWIQTLLGVGTVSVLSGGTNYSLGFVTFEYVPNPDEVREIMRERLEVTDRGR